AVSVIAPAPASSAEGPPTASAPDWPMSPPLLPAASVPAMVPLPRPSAPWLVAESEATSSVPSTSALASLIATAPPPSDTAPPKSLPAWVSVIAPAPASSAEVPPTASAPDWPTSPPLLSAASVPAILPLPRSSAPWLVAESDATSSVPRVSALASLITTAPPASDTAPSKSLPAWSSAIVPVPASIALSPPTYSAPDWPTSPPLLSATRAPAMLPPPSDRSPWLVADSDPRSAASSVSALASAIATAPPASDTAPPKSLPPSVSVIAPAPASSAEVPPITSAPDWLIAPPWLSADSEPATLPLPRSSAPWLLADNAPTSSTPSDSAPASLIDTALPVRETAPTKSLLVFSRVMSPAPASIVLLPPTSSAPDWPTSPPPLLATRLPAIVPGPRFSAPWLLASSEPTSSAPRPSALRSLTVTASPVSDTAPPKSLPASSSVMSPAPAL